MKKTIGICVMAVLGAMALAAETKAFKVTLPELSVGQTVLRAGNYAVVVDGDKVQIKDSLGKAIDVAAKVIALDKKTDATEVHSSKVDGVTVLSEIRPAGWKIGISFREPTTP